MFKNGDRVKIIRSFGLIKLKENCFVNIAEDINGCTGTVKAKSKPEFQESYLVKLDSGHYVSMLPKDIKLIFGTV